MQSELEKVVERIKSRISIINYIKETTESRDIAMSIYLEDMGMVLEFLNKLATSKDTEGCVRDRGYFPASATRKDAEPSGPILLHAKHCSYGSGTLLCDCGFLRKFLQDNGVPQPAVKHAGTVKARFNDAGKAECPEHPLPNTQLAQGGSNKEAVFKWGLQTIDRLIERHFDTEDQANIVGGSFNKKEALEALVIEIANLNEKLLHDEDFEPPLADNDRVMDLIRAAEKYFCQTEKDCHCLDMNYEVCDVCKEQLLAISVATNALPPHLIEQARGR